MRETIGILGGTFNPVHLGHIMLASYLVQWRYVDCVWLVLSPLNPLKNPEGILPDNVRMDMLEAAVRDIPGVEACDIELSMPRPSYTIDTLRRLSQTYPAKNFRPVIGSDNWLIFDRWRDYREILDGYGAIVYPRPGYDARTGMRHPGMQVADAPVIEISSTMIRQAIADGRDTRAFLPPGVYAYIKSNNLYQHP